MSDYSQAQQTIADGNYGKFVAALDRLRNINATDEYGNTLLHWAAAYKRLEMVKELIEKKKIDITIKNKTQKTAFDLVVDASATDMSFFEVKQYLKTKYQ
ncbi:hypothetical protein FDP41_012892 [Naegleria fowleri]|uniref:Uncharacterized protein n=1 Tax=Naegleria fowleri TaxID=5763 RepID=A0A6A5C3N4_NAEFO|nr:uncharacterized protein FDP41_012892 [Naegleria fowleri]KAF0981104.1 hypothetical protein FDP41_012892 [Naegleria fowleri]CAG4717522.1 unnamed protein product [Naegleria fowleri]